MKVMCYDLNICNPLINSFISLILHDTAGLFKPLPESLISYLIFTWLINLKDRMLMSN